jgi:uncharacterized membrane protein YfcA
MKLLSAFSGAAGVVVCGMVINLLGESIAGRDRAILDHIPTTVVIGGLLTLIPLSASAIIYLIAKSLGLVNVTTAMITGCLLGAACGWLMGSPVLRAWSGSLVGVAAALVWWKLYSRVPPAVEPSNTR